MFPTQRQIENASLKADSSAMQTYQIVNDHAHVSDSRTNRKCFIKSRCLCNAEELSNNMPTNIRNSRTFDAQTMNY